MNSSRGKEKLKTNRKLHLIINKINITKFKYFLTLFYKIKNIRQWVVIPQVKIFWFMETVAIIPIKISAIIGIQKDLFTFIQAKWDRLYMQLNIMELLLICQMKINTGLLNLVAMVLSKNVETEFVEQDKNILENIQENKFRVLITVLVSEKRTMPFLIIVIILFKGLEDN